MHSTHRPIDWRHTPAAIWRGRSQTLRPVPHPDPVRLDDLLGIDLLGLGFVTDHDAMPQDIRSNGLDIIRGDVTAPADKCMGAGSTG